MKIRTGGLVFRRIFVHRHVKALVAAVVFVRVAAADPGGDFERRMEVEKKK